ncbi:7253_t:CDS:2 [Ambispora gerdemannii]|uniref:7253_t:CDS:1 n=1 Tax=Ambispora gerdemannii TaxID=144530 RepID=A0A9N9D451_9GLOM|nr:7253_t:CDS:2 [Ambispora gerdemannii]
MASTRELLGKAERELEDAKAALKEFKEGADGQWLERAEWKEERDKLEEEKKQLEAEVTKWSDRVGDILVANATQPDFTISDEFEDLATAPFATKIPIESICYKNWKGIIGDRVDNYFIDGNANGTSGSSLSYKCQSALEQDHSGSENALLSRYDHLVRDIWCELSKNTRPDVVAWLNSVLIFKAEEKQFASDKAEAEQELLDKMEFWNRATYILAYAAAENLSQSRER